MQRPIRAYAALAVAGSLWGTGFLFGKIALTELSVPHMILYRLSFASAGFLPFLLFRRTSYRKEDWPIVVLAAVLGVPVLFLIQFEGLARTTVAHASLMVGMLPILLGIAAARFAGERLDARRWMLLAASTLGALLIVVGTPPSSAGRQEATLLGDLLVVISLFGAVGWVLLCKRLIGRYAPGSVSASVIVIGTTLLAAWVLSRHGLPPARLSAITWLALGVQGLLATMLAALLWNWGVAQVPASQAGVFVNLEPAIGAMLGVLIFHDRLGWTGVLGGFLIVGAAVVMTRLPATERLESTV